MLRALNHPVIVELRRSPTSGELLPARDDDEAIPGMLILRIEGGLYTLNVRGVQTRILEQAATMDPPPRVVLLDAGATVDTSVTVIDVMAETDQLLERMAPFPGSPIFQPGPRKRRDAPICGSAGLWRGKSIPFGCWIVRGIGRELITRRG